MGKKKRELNKVLFFCFFLKTGFRGNIDTYAFFVVIIQKRIYDIIYVLLKKERCYINAPNFFKQYLSQLKMFEENLKKLDLDEEDYEEFEDGIPHIGYIVAIILQRKTIELENKNNLENLGDYDNSLLEVSDMLIKNNKLAKKVYETMHVEDTLDGISYRSDIPGLMTFIRNRVEKNELDVTSKNKIELRSMLINLCIAFESVLSQMLREYYLFSPQPEMNQEKKITYSDLIKIGDIEYAKGYLIDIQIDELFRKKFDDWIKEINKMFSGKDNLSSIKKEVASISEMYQRRNLFVHNNGVVNSQYLKNVEDSKYREDETIDINVEYMNEKIKDLRHISWILLDEYLKRHFRDVDKSFSVINNIILSNIHDKCDSMATILKWYSKCKCKKEEVKIIAKINYFLYYKINGGLKNYDEEIKSFSVEHLSIEYQVAKAILEDSDECVSMVDQYLESLDDSDFFEICDWPLFKASKEKQKIKDSLNERLDFILEE